MRKIALFLLVFVFFVGAGFSFAGVKKKVLMIIAHNNFRDEELFVTKGVLETCGAKVEVVSNQKGVAKGMLGKSYEVDKTYRDVDWNAYQAIILVGGSGAVVFWQDNILQSLVQQAYKKGKIVAAICLSPVVLAKAGILKGRKATCWMGASSQLKRYGAVYTGKWVEVSGRIVTAAGPFAARDFGRAICRLLGYR